MEQGWVSLHRQIRDHWLWEDKPFSKGQAWVDMILRANHEKRKVCFENSIIEIPTGGFLSSETALAEAWGWSRKKTHSFIDVLTKDGMLGTKRSGKGTVFYLINYSNFSIHETEKEPEKNRTGTDEEPMRNTNNNVNNDNTENNIINMGRKSKFSPPTVDQIKAYCLERNNHVDAERFVDYYSANGWVQGKGKPIKDWKACVRTWERGNNIPAREKAPAQSISEKWEAAERRAIPPKEIRELYERSKNQ